MIDSDDEKCKNIFFVIKNAPDTNDHNKMW